MVDLYTWEDIEAAAPAVLARLRSSKSADDDRLKTAEAALDLDPKTAEPAQRRRFLVLDIDHPRQEAVGKRRAVLREAMQVSYEAADELHAQARGFRNVLVIATVVLTMLVVAPACSERCDRQRSRCASSLPRAGWPALLHRTLPDQAAST